MNSRGGGSIPTPEPSERPPVKQFVGLSRAVLTFLPVARRWCVQVCNRVVFWRARSLARTPAERIMEELNRGESTPTGIEEAIALATHPETSETTRLHYITILMYFVRRPIDSYHPNYSRPLYHDATWALRQAAPLLDEIVKSTSSPTIREKASKLAPRVADVLRRLPPA